MMEFIKINSKNEVVFGDTNELTWAYNPSDLSIPSDFGEVENHTWILENGLLIKKADYRNETWYKKTDASQYTPELGIDFDSSIYTKVLPLENVLHQKFVNDEWIEDIEEKQKHENLEKVKLIENLKSSIDNYLQIFCRDNFVFKNVHFNGDRESCRDVVGAVTLKNSLPSEMLSQMKHTWRRLRLSSLENTDLAYEFTNYADFVMFGVSMGTFYEAMFQVRSELIDSLLLCNLEELKKFDVPKKWGELLNNKDAT